MCAINEQRAGELEPKQRLNTVLLEWNLALLHRCSGGNTSERKATVDVGTVEGSCVIQRLSAVSAFSRLLNLAF